MEPGLILGLCLLLLGVVLLVHHGVHHHSDDPLTSSAQRESCAAVCYFQPKDIAHCETGCLVCLTNALTIGLLAPLCAGDFPGAVLNGVVAIVLFVLCVFFLAMCGEEDKCFSPSKRNVRNHETWVLVCLTNAASFGFLR